jgi:uncharacterized delta-60 repeat protein
MTFWFTRSSRIFILLLAVFAASCNSNLPRNQVTVTTKDTNANGSDLDRAINNQVVVSNNSNNNSIGINSAPSTAPGALDSTFRTTSLQIKEFQSAASGAPTRHPMAIQADGKIIVGLSFFDNFTLVRYNSDGSRDISFGNGGTVTTKDIGVGLLSALAIQSDGKIVVGGRSFYRLDVPNQMQIVTNNNLALVRYNSDGSLDTAFGSESVKGVVLTNIANIDSIIDSIAIQYDGKIVVGGHAYTNPNTRSSIFVLARYGKSGKLDAAFGNNGSGVVLQNRSEVESHIPSLMIDPFGSLILLVEDERESYLVAYNTNGSLDANYGNNGRIDFNLMTADGVELIKGLSFGLQSDRKIVIGASDFAGHQSSMAVMRIDKLGNPDISFGPTKNGVITLANYAVNAIAIQNNGKILVGGNLDSDTDGRWKSAILRYTVNGALDTSFGGGNGIAKGQSQRAIYSLLLQNDGKVIAGEVQMQGVDLSNLEFMMERFLL